MADINESIEQLTASLQELAATRAGNRCGAALPVCDTLSAGELITPKEVESFVQRNRDYASRTRSISVGTY